MAKQRLRQLLTEQGAREDEIQAFTFSLDQTGAEFIHQLIKVDNIPFAARRSDMFKAIEILSRRQSYGSQSQGATQALMRIVPLLNRHFPVTLHRELWRSILQYTPSSKLHEMRTLFDSMPWQMIQLVNSRDPDDLIFCTEVVDALKNAIRVWPDVNDRTEHEDICGARQYSTSGHAVMYISRTIDRNTIVRAMYDGSDGLDDPGSILESFSVRNSSSRTIDHLEELACLARFGIDFRDLDTDYKWQGVDAEFSRLKSHMSRILERVSGVIAIPALSRLVVNFLCHDKMLV